MDHESPDWELENDFPKYQKVFKLTLDKKKKSWGAAFAFGKHLS